LSEGRSLGSILRETRVHRARVTHPFVARTTLVKTECKRASELKGEREEKEKRRFNDARRCKKNPFVGAMRREHSRDADFARISAPAPVLADAAIVAAADPDPAADVAVVAVTALLHPLAATAAYLTAIMKIPPLS